jgi:hypothetical protein
MAKHEVFFEPESAVPENRVFLWKFGTPGVVFVEIVDGGAADLCGNTQAPDQLGVRDK